MFYAPKKKGSSSWKNRLSHLANSCQDPRLIQFYQAWSLTAATPLSQVRFLALDLEATGLNPLTDQILSIGYIGLSWDRIFCDLARNWIIQPEKKTENTQTTIHGITHSRMADSPRFEEIIGPLLEAMAGRVIIAHFSRIEREFLNRVTLNATGEPLIFPAIDTMELESRKHPLFRPNAIQRWMGKRTALLCGSPMPVNDTAFPDTVPHHALTDALATAELFLAQVADQFSPETPVGELWDSPERGV